ncbi:BLUF domain-containing protein [Polynucleobacter sp. es-MAR-4]|uniref:BLUF domain-containing protein n=1 Tax=Polynucleobacter sp. es-MAR-4 TaxID=1855655 RepID=UPI001C0BE311|nr:BLUF domain-containing protein [Polynucleobacter sp. es-MAR-4]MBU3637234.1 BLUF domain-containing protein [Polynucleobacter sp. es-MAR-4]
MSKSQLISVSYISKATQDMGVLALMRLTDQAAQLNQRLGLTGVLFYENQHFGQILEGPRAEVTKMWEKIQRDPRHQQVRLLKMEEIAQRSFTAWSMRFFLAKEIIAKMPNLTGVLDGLPEHDDELLRLMRTAAS